MTPAPPPSPAPRPQRRRLALLLALAAGLVLALAAVIAGLGWTLKTPAGSAWLLGQLQQRVPGLVVHDAQGPLLGDFSARELRVDWGSGQLQLLNLRWQGLQAQPLTLSLQARRLTADSARLTLQPSDTPSSAPTDLSLPVQLVLDSVQLGRLDISGQAPLTGLQGRVRLAREGEHQIDLQALRWQQLGLRGSLRVGTQAPLVTHVQLDLGSIEGADFAWRGQARADGPLATLKLHAELQAQRQTLKLDAQVLPFEAWPLRTLDAHAQDLDLAALYADWPRSALSGQVHLSAGAADAEAQLALELHNAAAGRWDQGRLPVQTLQLALSGRPDQPTQLRLTQLQAELSGGARISGQGRHEADGRWQLQAQVQGLRPEALDGRATAARLDGPLQLEGGGGRPLAARLDLAGQIARQPLQLQARLLGQAQRWEVQSLRLQAGGAELTLQGQLDLAGRADLQLHMRELDPRLLWRGAPDSAWARLPEPTRLNADATLKLQGRSLATLSGRLDATLPPSRLAGLGLQGQVLLAREPASAPARFELQAELGSSRVQTQGSLQGLPQAASAQGQIKLQARALQELKPLLALFAQPAPAGQADLDGEFQLTHDARSGWQLGSQGQLRLSGVSLQALELTQAELRWTLPLAPGGDGPLALQVQLLGLRHPQARLDRLQLQLQGLRSAHKLSLSTEGRLPAPLGRGGPDWQLSARAEASGRWEASGGWQGRIARLQLGPLRPGMPALLDASDLTLQLGPEPSLNLAPGRAELGGAFVSWQALNWRGGDAPRAELKLQLESLSAAPWLARWQPEFGWGGDLRVAGHADLLLTDRLSGELLLERQQGDLQVTDELGAHPLRLTDLRLAASVRDGVWQVAQGLAGADLGSLAGAVTLRPGGAWPDAATPLEGVLQANVAKLSNWGVWVPAGWRVGGQLAAEVQLGGRLGAPELRGQAQGQDLALRHLLYGVDFNSGRFLLALNGQQAELKQLEARGGDGWLRATGQAQLGEQPQARLQFSADKLRLLSRVDRRIVASGEASLALDRQGLTLDGQLRADEGLIDVSQADAPALADDVQVLRGRQPGTPAAAPASRQRMDVKLGLDFGRDFKLRGRGLAATVRGQLQLTQQGTPPPRLTGRLSVAGGQYAAYGQKLEIERGDLSFTGALDNPALDLLAVRPNLDTRVGVRVSGTALSPRVSLYSEPEMADTDKLSWLLLGRGPDGLGRTDTALLQRAAVALLAGEGEGLTGRAIKGLGLDELSLGQAEDDTRATIVRLGKQLSRHWYVGYERSLNATTGSWQLIYRIAQRFTLRAQSGDDNALDLIWQWKWD